MTPRDIARSVSVNLDDINLEERLLATSQRTTRNSNKPQTQNNIVRIVSKEQRRNLAAARRREAQI
jgi:hypothetical protein